MPELKIIPAPATLKSKIAQCQQETYEQHRQQQPYFFPPNLWKKRLCLDLDSAFSAPNGTTLAQSPVIFTALLDGEFAGYIQLSATARDTAETPGYVNVEDIYVVDKYRENSIGAALLSHVKSLSDQRGWHNLTATVWEGNAASTRLFEAAEFTQNCVNYRYGPTGQLPDLPAPAAQSSRFAIYGVGVILIVAAFLAGWVLSA